MDEAALQMTSINVPCALRTHRRTWGLSQQELADLLGIESRAHVSRLEHGKRTPGLETALACSTLFGVSPDELFPQLAVATGEKLRERISRRLRGPLDTTNISGLRKRELFARAFFDVGERERNHAVA